MRWRVVLRPEVEQELAEAATWYEARQQGLGAEFIEEAIRVLDSLTENPLISSRRHAGKNIRWRFPEKFPYRIIYEVFEADRVVIVAAVLHAARDDRHWKDRFS